MAVVLSSSDAVSDSVTLKNGKVVDGVIIDENSDELRVETPTGLRLTIPRRSVRTIERQASKEAVLTLGDRLFEKGHFSQAIDAYRRSMDEDLAIAIARMATARQAWRESLASGGRLATDEAREQALREHLARPNLPEEEIAETLQKLAYLLMERGRRLSARGKAEEGMRCLREAMTLAPETPGVTLTLCRALSSDRPRRNEAGEILYEYALANPDELEAIEDCLRSIRHEAPWKALGLLFPKGQRHPLMTSRMEVWAAPVLDACRAAREAPADAPLSAGQIAERRRTAAANLITRLDDQIRGNRAPEGNRLTWGNWQWAMKALELDPVRDDGLDMFVQRAWKHTPFAVVDAVYNRRGELASLRPETLRLVPKVLRACFEDKDAPASERIECFERLMALAPETDITPLIELELSLSESPTAPLMRYADWQAGKGRFREALQAYRVAARYAEPMSSQQKRAEARLADCERKVSGAAGEGRSVGAAPPWLRKLMKRPPDTFELEVTREWSAAVREAGCELLAPAQALADTRFQAVAERLREATASRPGHLLIAVRLRLPLAELDKRGVTTLAASSLKAEVMGEALAPAAAMMRTDESLDRGSEVIVVDALYLTPLDTEAFDLRMQSSTVATLSGKWES